VHLITWLHHSQLITSLDFLDTVPELAEWYQGLTFTRNPFVLAVRPRIPVWLLLCGCPKAVLIVPYLLLQLNIDARPPTPRKKTRRVRVGKDYVEKEFKSLVEGHNMDVQAQQVHYGSDMLLRSQSPVSPSVADKLLPWPGLPAAKQEGHCGMVAVPQHLQEDILASP